MRSRRYTPRDWREVAYSPEPLTINADVVAEFLDSQNRPGMAQYVRHVGRAMNERIGRENELLDKCHRLQAQLEQYEPRPAPYFPPTGKSKPESSD